MDDTSPRRCSRTAQHPMAAPGVGSGCSVASLQIKNLYYVCYQRVQSVHRNHTSGCGGGGGVAGPGPACWHLVSQAWLSRPIALHGTCHGLLHNGSTWRLSWSAGQRFYMETVMVCWRMVLHGDCHGLLENGSTWRLSWSAGEWFYMETVMVCCTTVLHGDCHGLLENGSTWRLSWSAAQRFYMETVMVCWRMVLHGDCHGCCTTTLP